MNTKIVSLDLETLSTKPNAYILSIGAVELDLHDDDFGSTRSFYAVIKPHRYPGFDIDSETVGWWFGQSDKARKEFVPAGMLPILDDPSQYIMGLPAALFALSAWFPKGATLWTDGAAQDCVWLRSAYTISGLEPAIPWGFRDERCYRTIRETYPHIKADPLPGGVHHNALSDAKFQAQHLRKIYRFTDFMKGPRNFGAVEPSTTLQP